MHAENDLGARRVVAEKAALAEEVEQNTQQATLLWRSEREWCCERAFVLPRGCGCDMLETRIDGPSMTGSVCHAYNSAS